MSADVTRQTAQDSPEDQVSGGGGGGEGGRGGEESDYGLFSCRYAEAKALGQKVNMSRNAISELYRAL